jgi:hypothetical protein
MYNRHELLDMALTFAITRTDIRWQWQVRRKKLGRRLITMHMTGFDSPGDGLMVERAVIQGPNDECWTWCTSGWWPSGMLRARACLTRTRTSSTSKVFVPPPLCHCLCESFGRRARPSLFFMCQLGPIGSNYAAIKWIWRRMMIEKLPCHVYNRWTRRPQPSSYGRWRRRRRPRDVRRWRRLTGERGGSV